MIYIQNERKKKAGIENRPEDKKKEEQQKGLHEET